MRESYSLSVMLDPPLIAPSRYNSPVVEILGPAGAGKTTLIDALCQSHPRLQMGTYLHQVTPMAAWLGNLLWLLPIVLSQHRQDRPFSRKELREMIYLRAWYQALTDSPRSPSLATVFDHGPLFRLARFRDFGPDTCQNQQFQQWWNTALQQWAMLLDLIIWVDAPDSILLERIQTRSIAHQLKGKTDPEGYEFLTRYRKTYDQIMAALMQYNRVPVLCVNTHQESVQESVNRVLRAIQPPTP